MVLKHIIFGLIIFIIFTTTGIIIVNRNIQNNNIILTEYQEHDIINMSKEFNIYKPTEKPKEESMPEYNIPLNKDIQKYLYNKCKEYDVQYDLALGVIKIESNFNSNLVHKNPNGSRDYGLFQINTINHKWLSEKLGINDFLDPYQNIDAGLYILSQLLKKYNNNEHIVLMSYNMGERATKNLVSRGINSSQYSRKVVETKEDLKNNNIK